MSAPNELESRLKVLEAEISDATGKLFALRTEETDIKLKLIYIKHGVEVGSIVVAKRNAKSYRVTLVSTKWGTARPWVSGAVRKVDGNFGAASVNLFDDWTLSKHDAA